MTEQVGVANLNETVVQDTGIESLEHRVRSELGNRVRRFQLLRFQQGLILKGHAQTYYAKQMAQQVIMRTSNEPIVANEIEVT